MNLYGQQIVNLTPKENQRIHYSMIIALFAGDSALNLRERERALAGDYYFLAQKEEPIDIIKRESNRDSYFVNFAVFCVGVRTQQTAVVKRVKERLDLNQHVRLRGDIISFLEPIGPRK